MEATAILAPSRQAPASAGALTVQEWARVVSSLGLTRQQARIVQLILEGKADKQIARQMRLSFGTVRAQLTRVFQRTGTSGRMELAALVFARVSAIRSRKDAQQ